MNRPDYKSFLLVLTTKNGKASVVASSDSEDEIGEIYLKQVKINAKDIESGDFRLDVYKFWQE